MSNDELLNPVAEVDAPSIQAPRLKDLRGKVIALVDNEMPGSGPLLNRLGENLMERFKLAGAQTIKRFVVGANPNLLENSIAELSKKVDFAITGLGS
ncbi:MAG: hypothetical protein HYX92_18145 [Chloroflexi bacterium]|nr:hypothetical protein [Chloroflexota bacterium]